MATGICLSQTRQRQASCSLPPCSSILDMSFQNRSFYQVYSEYKPWTHNSSPAHNSINMTHYYHSSPPPTTPTPECTPPPVFASPSAFSVVNRGNNSDMVSQTYQHQQHQNLQSHILPPINGSNKSSLSLSLNSLNLSGSSTKNQDEESNQNAFYPSPKNDRTEFFEPGIPSWNNQPQKAPIFAPPSPPANGDREFSLGESFQSSSPILKSTSFEEILKIGPPKKWHRSARIHIKKPQECPSPAVKHQERRDRRYQPYHTSAPTGPTSQEPVGVDIQLHVAGRNPRPQSFKWRHKCVQEGIRRRVLSKRAEASSNKKEKDGMDLDRLLTIHSEQIHPHRNKDKCSARTFQTPTSPSARLTRAMTRDKSSNSIDSDHQDQDFEPSLLSLYLGTSVGRSAHRRRTSSASATSILSTNSDQDISDYEIPSRGRSVKSKSYHSSHTTAAVHRVRMSRRPGARSRKVARGTPLPKPFLRNPATTCPLCHVKPLDQKIPGSQPGRKCYNFPLDLPGITQRDGDGVFVKACNSCALRYQKSNGMICANPACLYTPDLTYTREIDAAYERLLATNPNPAPTDVLPGYICNPPDWPCGSTWTASQWRKPKDVGNYPPPATSGPKVKENIRLKDGRTMGKEEGEERKLRRPEARTHWIKIDELGLPYDEV